jgi:hypothetical protein
MKIPTLFTLRGLRAVVSVLKSPLHRRSIALAAIAASALFASTAEAHFQFRRWPDSPAYWASRGNGFILEQTGSNYRLYEVSRMSLLPIGRGVIQDGALWYEGGRVIGLDEFTSQCDRIGRLPARPVRGTIDDPRVAFDLAWTTIDEYYAFFDLAAPGLWARQYFTYRPRVQASTTQDELWAILTEMIKPLNDGHMMLVGVFTDPESHEFDQRIEFAREPSPSSWMVSEDWLPQFFDAIKDRLDTYSPETNVLGDGRILFGTIGQRVGYLNISSYEGYSEAAGSVAAGDPQLSILTLLSGFGDELTPFNQHLDRVFSAFANVDALIIDLRFNDGGSGDLPVALANRLTDKPALAYTYRTRIGGSTRFDTAVPTYLTPVAHPFVGKPVIVLTSNHTKSAGDLQAMLLRDFPNVTLVGETTYGIFSEAIPHQIPVRTDYENQGWVITMSTQRLFSARGECFEQKGVPPDIEVHPALEEGDAPALKDGKDSMLETALELLADPAALAAARKR